MPGVLTNVTQTGDDQLLPRVNVERDPVHAIKVQWECKGTSPLIPNLNITQGERSASRSGRYSDDEKLPGTH